MREVIHRFNKIGLDYLDPGAGRQAVSTCPATTTKTASPRPPPSRSLGRGAANVPASAARRATAGAATINHGRPDKHHQQIKSPH